MNMIAMLILLGILAGVGVWLVGRRDAAQDPRVTVVLLGLLVVAPLLGCLPGLAVLPSGTGGVDEGVRGGISWGWVFSGIWLLGVMVGILRLGLGLIGLVRWRGRSVHLGWREGIELRVLEGLEGPVACGILRRVIYLPGHHGEWTEEVREAVMRHEMCHHARRDPLWRTVAGVACAVHWFNPLVWWVARRFAMQCEFACDAAVLESGVGVRRYVDVLCDLAWSEAPPAAAVAMSRRGALEARVRRMGGEARGLSRWVVILVGVLVFSGGVAVCLLRPAEREVPGMAEEVEVRLSAEAFPGGEG
jgi:hypothetical protein